MRTVPNFGKKEPVKSQDKDDPWGCVRIPLFVIASYYVMLAIVRYTSGSGSRLDKMICFGALIVFVIIMLLGVGDMVKESLSIDKEKQRWKDSCRFVEVAIVNRHGYPGGSYEDEYGIPHSVRSRYRLTLKLPNQIGVEVDVSESIYAKLEQRRTVRINYKPESPLTFLLEEEI